MTFKEFTATASELKVIIVHPTPPALIRFELNDLTTVDMDTPTSTTGTEYTYIYPGDYSNGIYACTTNPDEGTDEVTVFISNMLKGMNCLLKKVLREEYDCVLIQELEAVKQYTFLQQEDLARNVYAEIEKRCAICETSYLEGLSGISIWIINNDFIVQ